MFKIEFDPKTARWQIKIQQYGFLWTTIETQEVFDNYAQAERYVEQVGLRNCYRNYRETTTYHLVAGGAR